MIPFPAWILHILIQVLTSQVFIDFLVMVAGGVAADIAAYLIKKRFLDRERVTVMVTVVIYDAHRDG